MVEEVLAVLIDWAGTKRQFSILSGVSGRTREKTHGLVREASCVSGAAGARRCNKFFCE